MTIQLQPVAHALELKCKNQTMTMTADHVLHCIKSFVALINGGPFCINNRPVLLTISLSVGPRLVCSTLLRRPLETSKTVEGILCLLLRLLLRLSLLCPCCSLQIYIFKHLLQYRTIDALSVSGIGSLLAACAQSIVLSSTAAA